jgi:hypothetical protein
MVGGVTIGNGELATAQTTICHDETAAENGSYQAKTLGKDGIACQPRA